LCTYLTKVKVCPEDQATLHVCVRMIDAKIDENIANLFLTLKLNARACTRDKQKFSQS